VIERDGAVESKDGVKEDGVDDQPQRIWNVRSRSLMSQTVYQQAVFYFIDLPCNRSMNETHMLLPSQAGASSCPRALQMSITLTIYFAVILIPLARVIAN
jgi:hypothetical protein